MKKTTFLLFILTAFTASIEAYGKKSTELTVGMMFRLNDKYNTTVNSLVDGVELAKEQFEKKNRKYKINLKRYSHEADLASVAQTTEQVVKDGVPALIAGEMSSESLVIGEILNEKRIVLMTPTSSNPKVTENRPYVFRGCFSDSEVAKSMARYVYEKLKPGKIGVIHNVSHPYSDYLSEVFVRTFNEIQSMSKTPKVDAIVEKVIKATYDFDKITRAFAEQKVTHVIMLTLDSDMLLFTASAAKIGYYPAFVGSDAWGSNEGVFRTFVTDSTAGEHFVGYRNTYWHQESRSASSVKFKKLFKDKYGKEPTAWSAIGFDSATVLFRAMKKARKPNDSAQIQAELKNFSAKDLVTSGNVQFDETNSPRKDLVIYRIDKGGIHHEDILK